MIHTTMKTSSTIIRKQCRILTLFVLLFVQSVCAFAGQWVDVTDAFVKNPRFDGNSYANWEGTALSGNGAVNNAEHYYKAYDTYQKLSGLTPGKYRVSVQAFYRMGTSANDYSLYSSGDYSESQIATVLLVLHLTITMCLLYVPQVLHLSKVLVEVLAQLATA